MDVVDVVLVDVVNVEDIGDEQFVEQFVFE